MYTTIILFLKKKKLTLLIFIILFYFIFLDCRVNFRQQNYTKLTSKCKAPKYYGRLCCPAFKDFACPFSDDLNDVNNNDCAYIMFSFINLHGKYPPGLFFDKCVEGKFGLRCPDVWHRKNQAWQEGPTSSAK